MSLLSTTHDWISTYTGQKFFLDNPVFKIRDIAHALANQCRFTGHVKKFYSIAEHSVRMVRFVRKAGWSLDMQFAVLMHDASEAYLTDIASPYKKLAVFEGYRQMEHGLMKAISKWFKFDYPFPSDVKSIDQLILRAEARDLFKEILDEWCQPPSRKEFGRIRPWRPWWAERQFLKEYERLAISDYSQSNFYFFGLFLRPAA